MPFAVKIAPRRPTFLTRVKTSAMPSPSRNIAPASGLVITTATPLGTDQKTFNTLIKKLDTLRTRHAEWIEATVQFRQRYVSELQPLQDKETRLYAELAHSLHRAYGQKGVTKAERRKLSIMITQLTEIVLSRTEDDEIKALYNFHNQSDFDAEEAENQAHLKSVLESLFGVELGDDVDLNSPEAVMEEMQRHFEAEQPGLQNAKAEADAKAKPRKKSAKQLAKEARVEAEEKQLSQSIRDVYRKLASALHPDREPDPAERERKTTLMQRANEAYENGNLLQLLELQLQLEQIDPAHLASLDGVKLKHYIKILRGQIRDLESELGLREFVFAQEFNLPQSRRLSPSRLMSLLQTDITHATNVIRQAELDIESTADPKRFKTWLRKIKLHPQPMSDFDLPY